MLVYGYSPLPTLLQYTSSVRALASLCPHDGIYMGVIAPELIVGFCTHPVLLGTLRLPPWHADRNSACSGSIYRQPMISSCRVAIPPHTTTLNWLNRCTNSGDISITRSAIPVPQPLLCFLNEFFKPSGSKGRLSDGMVTRSICRQIDDSQLGAERSTDHGAAASMLSSDSCSTRQDDSVVSSAEEVALTPPHWASCGGS